MIYAYLCNPLCQANVDHDFFFARKPGKPAQTLQKFPALPKWQATCAPAATARRLRRGDFKIIEDNDDEQST
jgi:hypothetical protein